MNHNRLYRAGNYPILRGTQLPPELTATDQLDSLTGKVVRNFYAHYRFRSPPWCNLIAVSTFLLVTFQLGRSLLLSAVITDHQHLLVTVLGSTFALVNAPRTHAEIAVFHYSLYIFVVLLLLFGRRRANFYFSLILAHCDRQLLSAVDDGKPNSSSNELARRQRYRIVWYRWAESAIVLSMAGNVFLTSLAILAVADPRRNNYHLFGHSPVWYSLYAVTVSACWATWAYYCCSITYFTFVLFLHRSAILQAKVKRDLSEMRRQVRWMKQDDQSVRKLR